MTIHAARPRGGGWAIATVAVKMVMRMRCVWATYRCVLKFSSRIPLLIRKLLVSTSSRKALDGYLSPLQVSSTKFSNVHAPHPPLKTSSTKIPTPYLPSEDLFTKFSNVHAPHLPGEDLIHEDKRSRTSYFRWRLHPLSSQTFTHLISPLDIPRKFSDIHAPHLPSKDFIHEGHASHLPPGHTQEALRRSHTSSSRWRFHPQSSRTSSTPWTHPGGSQTFTHLIFPLKTWSTKFSMTMVLLLLAIDPLEGTMYMCIWEQGLYVI
jgi:hypothetical protein